MASVECKLKIKRFIAPDMRSALRQVRNEHGAEAVILSNRPTANGIEIVAATNYDEALVQKTLREVAALETPAPTATDPAVATLAFDPATSSPTPVPMSIATPSLRGTQLPDSVINALAAAASAYATPPVATPHDAGQAPAAPAQGWRKTLGGLASGRPGAARLRAAVGALWPLKAAPAAGAEVAPAAAAAEAPPPAPPSALVRSDAAPILQLVSRPSQPDPGIAMVRDELGEMRRLIQRELGQVSGERLRAAPARDAALNLLEDFGIEPKLAQRIAAGIDAELPPAQVLDAVRASLAALIPLRDKDPMEVGGVIALLGPTGAGKTTTAAKLAARYAQVHGSRNVAMVSIDRHRAAAREQLQAHGRRLGITVCEADGPDALTEVLVQLADYPLVIIDTAGLSPHDKALGSQLAGLQAIGDIHGLLVLPANGNPHDLSDLVERYASFGPKAMVLTKTDETHRLGAPLSVAIRHGLPLAYTGKGQAVPGDIDDADAIYLASRLEKVETAADTPAEPSPAPGTA